MHRRKEPILFDHICAYKETESRLFYCSVMLGDDVLLKATSGPRPERGWEPLT